jgi:hypothetical protein
MTAADGVPARSFFAEFGLTCGKFAGLVFAET